MRPFVVSGDRSLRQIFKILNRKHRHAGLSLEEACRLDQRATTYSVQHMGQRTKTERDQDIESIREEENYQM